MEGDPDQTTRYKIPTAIEMLKHIDLKSRQLLSPNKLSMLCTREGSSMNYVTQIGGFSHTLPLSHTLPPPCYITNSSFYFKVGEKQQIRHFWLCSDQFQKQCDITFLRENTPKEINVDRRDLLCTMITKFGPRVKMMLGIRKLTKLTQSR